MEWHRSMAIDRSRFTQTRFWPVIPRTPDGGRDDLSLGCGILDKGDGEVEQGIAVRLGIFFWLEGRHRHVNDCASVWLTFTHGQNDESLVA
jgi:hypothetical protein